MGWHPALTTLLRLSKGWTWSLVYQSWQYLWIPSVNLVIPYYKIDSCFILWQRKPQQVSHSVTNLLLDSGINDHCPGKAQKDKICLPWNFICLKSSSYANASSVYYEIIQTIRESEISGSWTVDCRVSTHGRKIIILRKTLI